MNIRPMVFPACLAFGAASVFLSAMFFICGCASVSSELNFDAKTGNIAAFHDYLAKGNDVNAPVDERGTTLLDIASSWGQLDIARFLLEHGAKADGKNSIYWASRCGKPDALALVQLLVAHGADSHDPQLLNQAAEMGDAKLVSYFIEQKVDLNGSVDVQNVDPSKSGHLTPLGQAATSGSLDVVKLLLKSGADPFLGSDPVEWARKYGHEEIASYIENYRERHPVRSREFAAFPPTPAAAPVVVDPPSLPLLAPAFHASEKADDYALVVGIDKYDALPPAEYAERDAKAAEGFIEALGVPPRNVTTLIGAKATRSGLAKNLEAWLANNVNERSTVYFYFSGHGAPDPATGQAYLVPFDGDPQYLEQSAYPLKRLYERLGALKAKHVVVMLDSCFSGAGGRSVLAKGARPLVSHVDTGVPAADGKIAVFAAAGGDQVSGVSEANAQGLFTYYLLNGLNGDAKDGQGRVTLRSLYDYVRPKVMDDAHRANREQVPQLTTSETERGLILRGN